MKVIKSKEINHRPKVSVLISTYNKEKFINKTLDSVLKQSMDMRDFELIVVDDCSTDQTVDIVSKNRQFSNYKFIQLDQIRVHLRNHEIYLLI